MQLPLDFGKSRTLRAVPLTASVTFPAPNGNSDTQRAAPRMGNKGYPTGPVRPKLGNGNLSDDPAVAD